METRDEISVTTGPVTFANPVFLASGVCGYAGEYAPLVDVAGLGGVVTKTITMKPRVGNRPPRIHELPYGLLNSIGLENVGLDAYITDKLPALRDMNVPVVVSVAAETEDEFERLADAFAGRDGYLGIELNLSCPNVEDRALDLGRDPDFVERITRVVKKRIPDRALWVKVTPNVADIGQVARAAEAGGADAVSAVNTVVGMDFDLKTGTPVFDKGGAGYSGPGIFPIALRKVWECAHAVNIPVVGIGGISSVDDARKMFLAGASAVQVGTALYADPALPARIVEALGDEARSALRKANGEHA